MLFASCSECGGEVKLLTGTKRTREYRFGVSLPIPDDFEIPTCIKCKEEYMVPEISEPLDKILGDLFEKKLLKEIASLKKQVSFWKDGWFDQRDVIGKQSWLIPGPGKPLDYLKLNASQKELYHKCLHELPSIVDSGEHFHIARFITGSN